MSHDRSTPNMPETCQKCGQEALHTWGQCFRCQKWLGCPNCSARGINEVLCKSCLCWGTVEALLSHGPILKNRSSGYVGKQPLVLGQYPAAWRSEYEESEDGYHSEVFHQAPSKSHGRTVALTTMDLFKRGESLSYEDVFLSALEALNE